MSSADSQSLHRLRKFKPVFQRVAAKALFALLDIFDRHAVRVAKEDDATARIQPFVDGDGRVDRTKAKHLRRSDRGVHIRHVEGEMGKAGVARFCLNLPAIVRRQVLDEFQPMSGALDISDFYVRSFDTGNLSNEGGIAQRA